MKLFCVILTLLLQISAYADWAPTVFRGLGAEITVSSGSGFLASRGRSVFYTSLEGNQFSLLGDANIGVGYGTYSWTKLSANRGNMTLSDQVSGTTVTYALTFTSADGGTFSVNAPGIGTQAGSFDYYYILKPSAVSTVLAAGNPVLKSENGNAVIEVQIQTSTSLDSVSWQPQSGSVTTDGNGKLIFTAPLPTDIQFYRVELME